MSLLISTLAHTQRTLAGFSSNIKHVFLRHRSIITHIFQLLKELFVFCSFAFCLREHSTGQEHEHAAHEHSCLRRLERSSGFTAAAPNSVFPVFRKPEQKLMFKSASELLLVKQTWEVNMVSSHLPVCVPVQHSVMAAGWTHTDVRPPFFLTTRTRSRFQMHLWHLRPRRREPDQRNQQP